METFTLAAFAAWFWYDIFDILTDNAEYIKYLETKLKIRR